MPCAPRNGTLDCRDAERAVSSHVTSGRDPGEIDGVSPAAEEARIDSLELISIGATSVRLFRYGEYPALRGTYRELDQREQPVHTRGSVPCFGASPGVE